MRKYTKGMYAYSFGRVAFGSVVLLLPPAEESRYPAHWYSAFRSVSLLPCRCEWVGRQAPERWSVGLFY